jgi:ectoine hydroxylase-related dioxygenase (phytanoyl-CoA dioxygenase family)
MIEVPSLTQAQVDAFHRDGFLIARRLLSQRDMDTIATWSDELVAMPEESGRHWIYWEDSLREPGKKLINRIENIAPFHKGFANLAELLKKPVAQLLGDDAALFKEKINFKMPGGGGFAAHQDSQAGWDRYVDFFISALVSIDSSDEENGCLKMVAGHHNRGLFKSWEPLTEADMQGMEFVSCPTERGDVIFFDCYAPHASEPNLSNNIRRLYYATYNRLSAGDHMAQYYADKHKSYPPDIDRIAGQKYVFKV